MGDYRTFLGAILCPVLAMYVGLAGPWLAFRMDPFMGDLTRVGGYMENDFGWTGTQNRVELMSIVEIAYDHPAEMLVVGDSFSSGSCASLWQDEFYALTGIRSTTVTFPCLPTVLASEQFRRTPPRIVVLELVERNFLVSSLLSGDAPRPAAPKRPTPKPRAWTRHPVARLPVTRPRWSPAFPNFDLAWRCLSTKAKQGAGLNVGVKRVQLRRTDLFSSAQPDGLLVYENDWDKAAWTPGEIDRARKTLLALQTEIETAGSHFVFMGVPDKLSAYASEVSPGEAIVPIGLPGFLADRQLNALDLSVPLVAAIRAGEKDIYMPNDSHWGVLGSQVAAAALVEFLRRRNVLQATPAASQPG